MNPKSHTLFHFTKSKDILKTIIKEGFWPRYCQEDVNWLGYESRDFIAYPMVCFCDIPLSRIDEHVKFYGEFGIGLTRDWALQNNATPILYVSNNNFLPETFRNIGQFSSELEDKDKINDAKKTIRYLLAHTKPTEGKMVINGNLVEKEFYQESEWRCVPKHEDIRDHLGKSEIDDTQTLQEHNDKTLKNCQIKFTPKDVKYIFVKNDSDIPELINFIQSELGDFPHSDIKILMSRVISLESISRDL